MPLSTAAIGASVETVSLVDTRWLMAFAAAVGATTGPYLDTTRASGIVAHPVFPVALEWPGVTALRALPVFRSLTREEAARGVHSAHDTTWHGPLEAGHDVITRSTVIGVERGRAGAQYTTRHETETRSGAPVATSLMTSVFLGVDVDGPDRPAGVSVAHLPGDWQPSEVASVPIDAGAAHVYSECARIWNPIHTDPVVAAAAGLPGIILHGTATLAIALGVVVERFGAGEPAVVRRLSARFRGMVTMPGELRIETGPTESWPTSAGAAAPGTPVGFRVRTADGSIALDGFAILGSPG